MTKPKPAAQRFPTPPIDKLPDDIRTRILAVQEKSVRALTALAIRLRLSPQSRIDAKAMGRREPPMRVNPWEWDPNDTPTKSGALD